MATNNTAALRKDEGRNAAILERIPAGRWGVPDDLGGHGGVSRVEGIGLRQRLHGRSRWWLVSTMSKWTPRIRLRRSAGGAPWGEAPKALRGER